MQKVLVVSQFFHEDKLGGFRRPASVLIAPDKREAPAPFRFIVPSHRSEGEWAQRRSPYENVQPWSISHRFTTRGQFLAWLRYAKEYLTVLNHQVDQPDLTYIVSPPGWWGVPACLFSRLKKVPVVLDVGDSPASQARSLAARVLHESGDLLLRRLANHVITTSPDLNKGQKDSTLFTGIGDEFFHIGRKRLEAGGEPTGPLKLIYSGTLGPLQGLKGLMKFWQELHKRLPDSQFHIIGAKCSAEKNALQSFISDDAARQNLIVENRVSPCEVPARLEQAHWGVVSLESNPKLDYAVPTKMLEYSAAGLPVLGLGGARVKQLLGESGGGVFLPPKLFNGHVDEEARARTLDKLSGTLTTEWKERSLNSWSYANKHLKLGEYQRSVFSIFNKYTQQWSLQAERAINWLEREATLGPGDLGLDESSECLAMRHSTAPSRIEQADQWAYIEITAYQISLLINLYEISGREEYLAQARRFATWLVFVQDEETGAFPFVFDINARELKYPCWAFDAGMVIRALELLSRHDPDTRWNRARKHAMDWLATMQMPDGSFRAAEEKDGALVPPVEPPHHYSDGGALHLKLFLSYLRSGAEDQDFQEIRERLYERVGAFESEDGRFTINPQAEMVFSHTHCYALEGLSHEEALRPRWEKGMLWTCDILEEKSFLMPRFVGGPDDGPALDATGQALRMLAVAAKHPSSKQGNEKGHEQERQQDRFRETAAKVYDQLIQCQRTCGSWPESPDGGKVQQGSLQNYGQKLSGSPVWVTQFALAGMLAWECSDYEPLIF